MINKIFLVTLYDGTVLFTKTVIKIIANNKREAEIKVKADFPSLKIIEIAEQLEENK